MEKTTLIFEAIRVILCCGGITFIIALFAKYEIEDAETTGDKVLGWFCAFLAFAFFCVSIPPVIVGLCMM